MKLNIVVSEQNKIVQLFQEQLIVERSKWKSGPQC